jgi:hypothetical protein
MSSSSTPKNSSSVPQNNGVSSVVGNSASSALNLLQFSPGNVQNAVHVNATPTTSTSTATSSVTPDAKRTKTDNAAAAGSATTTSTSAATPIRTVVPKYSPLILHTLIASPLPGPNRDTNTMFGIICGSSGSKKDMDYHINFLILGESDDKPQQFCILNSVYAHGDLIGQLVMIRTNAGMNEIKECRGVDNGTALYFSPDIFPLLPTMDEIETETKIDMLNRIFILKVTALEPTSTVTATSNPNQPLQVRKGTALTMVRKTDDSGLETRTIGVTYWRDATKMSIEPGTILVMLNVKRELYKGNILFTPAKDRGCFVQDLHPNIKQAISTWFTANPEPIKPSNLTPIPGMKFI